MKSIRILLIAVLLCISVAARAEGPDEDYVAIYNMIQSGDALKELGEPTQALSKYAEAQNALIRFHASNPEWNQKIVNFRLRYLEQQISDLSFRNKKAPIAGENPVISAEPAKPAVNAVNGQPQSDQAAKLAEQNRQLESQLSALQEEVRRLDVDKTLMEAKLKEAFSSQPAPVSAGELNRALDKVRELEKKNELLQARLDSKKDQPAKSVPVSSSKLKKQLEEANAQMAQLQKSNASLRLERDAISTRLAAMQPENAAPNGASDALRAENELLKKELLQLKSHTASKNSSKSETSRKLEEAQAQLAVLQSEKEVMLREKLALEARVKQLTAAQNAPAVVKREAVTKTVEKPATGKKLAEAEARIFELQNEKQTWAQEKKALEERIKQLSTTPASAAIPQSVENKINDKYPGEVDLFYAAKIASLETQRDQLQKSLDAATRDLAGRKKGKVMSSRIDEMSRELAGLKASIDVLESKPIPYTAEELSLMSASPISLMSAVHKSGPKSLPQHSAKTTALMAEGRQFFVDHDREKAAEKFAEALKNEPGNFEILAELASVQLEQGKLDDAEKNLNDALKAEPDDYYSFYVLGQVKFMQKKYDDALNALSRASQITPQNANIENFIGMTLSEKGLRARAESSFRNAIRLDPNFAEAHLNLAVQYVTQKPPLVALARFHYQKAIALGHEKSPKLEALMDAASSSAVDAISK